jgi:hypothetical protein
VGLVGGSLAREVAVGRDLVLDRVLLDGDGIAAGLCGAGGVFLDGVGDGLVRHRAALQREKPSGEKKCPFGLEVAAPNPGFLECSYI